MHGELPEFKRCCFCLPLRRGLVGWGYFRLSLDVLAIIRLVFICVDIIRPTEDPLADHMSYYYYYKDLIFFIGIIIYYFTDAVFALFLIVGGHKKSHKLLRISYIYCIVWLGLLIVGGFMVYIYVHIPYLESLSLYTIGYMIIYSAMTFIVIFVQVYMILLTRSEEIKLLKGNKEMRILNNAESSCVCDDN